MKWPQIILDIQPQESTTIRDGDAAVFILWDAKTAEDVRRSLREDFGFVGRNIYPLGAFPNGDAVCWEDGFATVFFCSEDSVTAAHKSGMPFAECLRRILDLDRTLEEEIFRR